MLRTGYQLLSKGITVSEQEMAAINISHADFHGEWNHTIRPSNNVDRTAERLVPDEPLVPARVAMRVSNCMPDHSQPPGRVNMQNTGSFIDPRP
jgi:hypothetical protein